MTLMKAAMLVPGLRRLCTSRQGGALMMAVALMAAVLPAGAAGPAPALRPFLQIGPAQVALALPDGSARPQYGLFGCQAIGAGSIANCLDPYQMRTAYQVDGLIAAGFDGSGQTIVIVDAFDHPTLAPQVAFFDAFYGLPPTVLTKVFPDGQTPFDPNDGNMVGWAGEISLDVEWAHAIAPGAKIVLVLAKSNHNADIISALKYAVDNRLGDVISMSFGENESCWGPEVIAAYHQVFADATRKDIGLFASSGDWGAAQNSCGGQSWTQAVSLPASDPLVTGVGGTELTVAKYCLTALGCVPSQHPAPGTYLSEIVWNEGLPYGDFGNVFGFGTLASGGGYSLVYDAPPYQQAVLRGDKRRGVPDVAYSGAILHGVLTYVAIPGQQPGFFLSGGTSAGAPQWAALAAIANQKAGRALGFLNAAIYRIGRTPKASTTFHDITVGSNASLQFDAQANPVDTAGFSSGQGWDAATGVGSPMGATLVDQLIALVAPGDGVAAINASKANPTGVQTAPGKVKPH